MKILLLSGGKGKRLFPLSREYYPKQFIPIFNGKSLIELTIERFISNPEIYDDIYIVTNKNSLSFISNLKKNKNYNFNTIFEPISKNTAASIIYGLQFLDDEDIVGVFPVDHLIIDKKAFNKVILESFKFVDNSIVLLGIMPNRIETGFGYIEYKDNDVISFKEKPNFETAKKYVESKKFLWNSGIFIFKKKVLMEEFKKYRPDFFNMSEKLKEMASNRVFSDDKYFYPDIDIEKIFQSFESISLDYAIIEKTDKLKVIKAEFDWDDLGNIDSLTKKTEKALKGNFGSSDSLKDLDYFEYIDEKIDSKKDKNLFDLNAKSSEKNHNSIIGYENKSYGIIGYDDCKIIDTEDILLVLKEGYSKHVEKFYNWIETKSETGDKEILKYHKTVLKPWGYYKNIYDFSHNFKVKLIKICKGEQISLQFHQYREEHWIIVEGNGTIIIDDNKYKAKKSDRFFIPKKSIHQAIASEDEDLFFVEVQIGEVLSEDDIKRVEDKYKR